MRRRVAKRRVARWRACSVGRWRVGDRVRALPPDTWSGPASLHPSSPRPTLLHPPTRPHTHHSTLKNKTLCPVPSTPQFIHIMLNDSQHLLQEALETLPKVGRGLQLQPIYSGACGRAARCRLAAAWPLPGLAAAGPRACAPVLPRLLCLHAPGQCHHPPTTPHPPTRAGPGDGAAAGGRRGVGGAAAAAAGRAGGGAGAQPADPQGAWGVCECASGGGWSG